jgi:hypothetical protein
MRTLINTLFAVACWTVPAIAAGTGVAKGSSFLMILFLGFAALIVVFQFIPGLVLFYSMLKGIFTGAPKKSEANVKR